MAAHNGSQKTDMKIEGELGKKRHTENRRNRKDNGVTIIVRHLHHVKLSKNKIHFTNPWFSDMDT